MTDIITYILLGLFLLILAPAYGVGVFIIFSHMLLKKKSRPSRTYDDIMDAQREQRADRARDASIEDSERFRK